MNTKNRFTVIVSIPKRNPLEQDKTIVLYTGDEFSVARQIQDEYNDSSDKFWANLYDAVEQLGYPTCDGEEIVWDGSNASIKSEEEPEDMDTAEDGD